MTLGDIVEIADEDELLGRVLDWFGIQPAVFEPWVLCRPNRKVLNLVNRDCLPPARPKPVSIGMPFLRVSMRYPKLTTAAVYLIGKHAQSNVLEVERRRADRYLSRQEIAVEEHELSSCDSRGGYVILQCEGLTIGLGLLNRDRMKVVSFQPKAWAIPEDSSAYERF